MDICDGYRGYIKIGTDGYIIQPLKTEILQQNNLDGTPHTLEKLSGLLGQIQLYQGTIHILCHHCFDCLPFCHQMLPFGDTPSPDKFLDISYP